MLALSIDTSGDVAGVALVRDEVQVSELHFRHKMDLLRRLMPNVQRLVSDSGLNRTDIDGIVIALGPGSFTGLRIGMAAAKALAFALQKPIVGIPTLDVMAQGFAPRNGYICAMAHAKPGEVYTALYEMNGYKLNKIIPDEALAVTDLVEQLREKHVTDIIFVGEGARRNWAAIRELGVFAPPEYDFPRASVLALMGIERFKNDDLDDMFSLVPLYVRRPTPEIRLECR